MVGVRLNIPIRTERRDGAVAEAQARLAQRRAELARAIDQAGLQVQEAYEQAREAEQALKLYEESALPAARENVRLAQSSYTTCKVPFLNLIEAQRNLVELRDRQFELRAEAFNLTNTPSFNLPGSLNFLDARNFASITSMRNTPRQFQLGAKLYW